MSIDWHALMVETQTEWRKTLDALGSDLPVGVYLLSPASQAALDRAAAAYAAKLAQHQKRVS